MLHAQEHAENIGVERRGVAFRGLVRDRAGFTLGASVVHRDIEAPEALDRAVDETADIAFLAHIGLDEFGFGTERAEFANQRPAGIRLSPGNNNAMASLCERDGRCATYACERSCDQHD
jgi:hypothetical protein